MGLILKGDALATAIVAYGAARSELDRRLHVLACSAVAQAATLGRCDALNMLHSNMSKSYQDAMRAWLAPVRGTFGKLQWLAYSNTKGYSIVKGTINNRPSEETIEAVAADFDKSLMHAGAKKDAAEMDWNVSLERRLDSLAKYIKREAEEKGFPIPEQIIVDINSALAVAKRIKLVVNNDDKAAVILPDAAAAPVNASVDPLSDDNEGEATQAVHDDGDGAQEKAKPVKRTRGKGKSEAGAIAA